MGQADDLRTELNKQREAFRAAVEAAAEKWETSPGGDEWAPRNVAEHAIGADARYADRVAQAIQTRTIGWQAREFASAQDALAALEELQPQIDRVYRYIEDRDLAKRSPEDAQGRNVEAFLQLAASHLGEHANQLRSTP